MPRLARTALRRTVGMRVSPHDRAHCPVTRREPRHYHQFSRGRGLPIGPLMGLALVVCFGVWLLDLAGVIEISPPSSPPAGQS